MKTWLAKTQQFVAQREQTIHYVLAGSLCVFFAGIYSVLMLNKYWQFEYFFVDNVYFHEALWQLARFETPIVEHQLFGPLHIFGDHFHPTILLVAGLLRLFPANETVFIFMAVWYSLGGWLAFLISRKVLQNNWWIYPLLLAYFLYIGTQNAFIFGFHEINLLAPFFFATVLALIHKKWVWYWLALGLLLMTKESMAVIGVVMAVFAWFQGAEYRRIAVLTAVVSVGWYLLVTRMIIPHFSGGVFLYGTPALPSDPLAIADRLVTPPEKITTFVVSVSSFGFLPLLGGVSAGFFLQDFVVRYLFALPGNVQHTLQYHYGVATAPLLLLASIWGVKFLQQFKTGRRFLIPVFLLSVVAGTIHANVFLDQRSPVLSVINRGFYATTASNAFLWDLVAAAPDAEFMMVQNHLGLPLADRSPRMLAQNMVELFDREPEYLVFDTRDQQNPNNFFPSSPDRWLRTTAALEQSGLYSPYFSEGSLKILERTYPAGTQPPSADNSFLQNQVTSRPDAKLWHVLLLAADKTELLHQDRITLLLPINGVLTTWSDEEWWQLLESEQELEQFVDRHFLAGVYTPEQLAQRQFVQTVTGQALPVSSSGAVVTIGDTTILTNQAEMGTDSQAILNAVAVEK